MTNFQKTLVKMLASLILVLSGTLGIGFVFVSAAIIAQNSPSGSLLVDVVEWNMTIPTIIFSGLLVFGLYLLIKSVSINGDNSSGESSV